MQENLPIFLIDMLRKQYAEEIVNNIIDGYSKKRKTTFRVNTLKTNTESVIKILEQKNISYQKVLWSNEAFIIENAYEKDIEQLEIYKNGEIYMQSLSSMLPPIVLEPKQNADILDMAAAPGGKTTQIAALTENKANITACEMNQIRLERLKYNVEKQGATSVYVMQMDSRKIDDFFSFNQILLDAPCSGSGTLNINDSNMSKYFTQKLVDKSKSAQIQMLKKALKILKAGGQMVYSTCSILSCENEEIVKEALKGVNAEIVPINFEGIEQLPVLPSRLQGTICVAPNELYEGFYIAKIQKN